MILVGQLQPNEVHWIEGRSPYFSYMFLGHNLSSYPNSYHLSQLTIGIDLASFLNFTTILRTSILTVVALNVKSSKHFTSKFRDIQK